MAGKIKGKEFREVKSIRVEPSVLGELVRVHGGLQAAIDHMIKKELKRIGQVKSKQGSES
jgi:hypothetical protein